MFANALLILPDFATILLGLLLARVWRDGYDRGCWAGAERLVYYVLFPALLFASINNAQFSIGAELKMLGAAVGAFAVAVALAFAAQPLLKPAPDVFAACVQTGFRYNSYIGLALAQSLAGSRGVATLALIIAVCVPLANLFAVYALARHRELHLGRELIRNPLILSTVAGLVTNLLVWHLPAVAASFAQRLGSASLALGLLCIGAGLTLQAAQASPRVLGYFIAVKLAVFPAVAWALVQWLGLTGTAAQVVLLFAALPTASSAYVLAARMGGNAAPVAFIVTVQTLLAMLTVPLWLLLLRG
ncbi:MAG: AEC family transporter [Betaproteobacteria bacterium]